MRVDVVSIFPEYLAPLSLSLPGRAQASGLIDLRVHDLRRWTHDRHHTVDDTPYGGGAGMVMRPEPWGEALDELLAEGATLLVPTPAGEPFTQAMASQLATAEHLVLACGRYEGIDQRVVEHARTREDVGQVLEVSVGDYVLNGGEAAALVVLEAVARLLPGFMGNAASLVEESHGADGLLEHPVYTRPADWRGLAVPGVLLGGDHARIADWRHDQAVRRTSQRRPDLLPPSAVPLDGEGLPVRPATSADAGELLTVQRACWLQEALVAQRLDIPPLLEDLADIRHGIATWRTWVVRHPAPDGRLVGSVRGRVDPADAEVWEIGRLMVVPDLQGQGLGRALLEHAVGDAPEACRTDRLVTGATSEANLRRYRRAGFSVRGPVPDDPLAVVLTRRR